MARELTSIEPLLPVIRQRPLGLLSDIDGTLAPIVPRPEDAAVPDAVRALLGQLAARGVKVALITGRSLDMARRMAGLEDAAYAANHGLTLWLEGREEAAPPPPRGTPGRGGERGSGRGWGVGRPPAASEYTRAAWSWSCGRPWTSTRGRCLRRSCSDSASGESSAWEMT